MSGYFVPKVSFDPTNPENGVKPGKDEGFITRFPARAETTWKDIVNAIALGATTLAKAMATLEQHGIADTTYEYDSFETYEDAYASLSETGKIRAALWYPHPNNRNW